MSVISHVQLTVVFFFFCVPIFFSGVHLGFTNFGEIFADVQPFLNPTIEVVTFRLHGWCMLGVFFVAGIHLSKA